MKKILVALTFLGLSILLYAESNKIISWVKDSGIDSINVKKEYRENTSYDNFDDKKINVVLTEKDISLLQLESTEYAIIYAQYSLNLSNKFSTIIFSYETEHELNTILVNYNLKGENVGSLEVAYDEIAESAFRTTSVISKKNITIVEANYYDIPAIYTTNTYKIESDGKIVKMK